ncbi:molybdate ABC transporter substrate-binding protein [Verrucomicrobium sp. BvORR106]|uniref:molybdate ABC transporter substrate-binding protein n=1 Tax=Verrucomicrobium sp. BvORR106 TaxID=1403819 RepID=UPI00056DBEF3|nr:molybdate ABC transporter substrate-binding protein [Verrucomicrobium sp. BvORR106]
MKTRTLLSVLTALAVGSLIPHSLSAQTKELRVSAAASLADVLKEIHAGFEKAHGAKVELNLGASSALVRQIEAGAPADVFISADAPKMDQLEKAGLINTATREDQLSNALVVVVPADSKLAITSGKDLLKPDIRRLALGDPKAVPAGVYTKEWLTKLGLWAQVEAKVLATENVRAALAAVESGNVEAGVVYKTDAAITTKVKVALEVPASEGPVITYPMAALKEAKNADLAKQHLEYLDTPESHALFQKYGFIVLPEPKR